MPGVTVSWYVVVVAAAVGENVRHVGNHQNRLACQVFKEANGSQLVSSVSFIQFIQFSSSHCILSSPTFSFHASELEAFRGTMSVARSSECLFCSFSRSSPRVLFPRRQFHSSPVHQKRKPRFPSVKAEPNEINLTEAAKEFQAEKNGQISSQYSAEQRASIEAAQKLIDLEKLEKRTGMRTDPWNLKYYDELTKIDPVVDNPVRAPWTNLDDASRLKTGEEIEDDLIKFMNQIPDPKQGHENDFDPALWDQFDKNLRLTVGREEAERSPRTALAPDLPKVTNTPNPKTNARGGEDEEKRGRVQDSDITPALLKLMQMTGYSRRQLAQLRTKTVIMHSVTNQTRLGKIQRTYALSVAGNGNGLIGIGEGKSTEMEDARMQSQYRAIRNMTPILRYENRTIFGDVNAKVSATELELYARPPGMSFPVCFLRSKKAKLTETMLGFGLRCQQYIWEICKCAGIHDLAAKVTRSRNPMNTVKATVQALLSQKHPEDIARARGKKLVDVRKVYYAGQI